MNMDYFGFSLWTELMIGDKLWLNSLELEFEDEFVPDVDGWAQIFSKLHKVLILSGLNKKLGACLHTSMNIPLILKNTGMENNLKIVMKSFSEKNPFQFGMHSSFTENDLILNKDYKKVLKKDLELCSILNAVAIVEHPPLPGKSKSLNRKYQIKEMIEELTSNEIISLLESNKIILCWENMGNENEFFGDISNLIEFKNLLDDKLSEIGKKELIKRHLFCLDTGHLLLWSDKNSNGLNYANKVIEECIPEFAKNILVFHIHANDGNGDNHIVPFSTEFFDHPSRKNINKEKFLENSKRVMAWLEICEDYKKINGRHLHIEALTLPFSLNQFIEFGQKLNEILK